MIEYVVTEEQNELRADKIVKSICYDVGYVFLQKIFRTNRIKVNGKKVGASERLKNGDVIKIYADVSVSADSARGAVVNGTGKQQQKFYEQLEKIIIFENDSMFAINKPSGLAVQPGTRVSICVDTMIKARSDCKCHLVHRLDRDTSGVLLIAKNLKMAQKLSAMFQKNKIEKTYVAVVDGKIEKSGMIDNFLEKTPDGEKMTVSEFGQSAITNYSPVKQIGNHTLLELKPSTGRKHQLRVHCAEVLNAPILGDRKYNKNQTYKEMMLHAASVRIKEMGLEIKAEMPDYFRSFLDPK